MDLGIEDRTGQVPDTLRYRLPARPRKTAPPGLRPLVDGSPTPRDSAPDLPWSTRVVRHVRDSKIAHWAVGYIAFAYGGVELLDNLSELWNWSVAFQKTAVLLLACGLPPVLVLSWFHGEKGRQEMCAAEALILTVLLVLALVVVRVSSGAA